MANSFAKIVFRDLDNTVREVNAEKGRTLKAGQNAAKVEGYRLSSVLKSEIKAGAPGGKTFSPLTEMAKRMGRGAQSRTPLKRLSIPVRYSAGMVGDKFRVVVGYLTDDLSNPFIKSANRISRSWARIIKLHQEGGSIPVTPGLRNELLAMGRRLTAGNKNSRKLAKVFFLRKGTASLEVPERDIVEPFWAAHRGEAQRNIVNNFERKMKGERI